MNDRTIYELTQGGFNRNQLPARYFGPAKLSDATVRFSEAVLDMDRDENCNGGWVHLKRLPDSIYPYGQWLLAWTKTSNESPTLDGFLNLEDAK